MKKLFLFFALLGACFAHAQEKSLYVVDCNGDGDFASVQACFDALPSKPAAWRTVRIMPGVYREKVTLDVYKDKVAILGYGARIVWNDFSGKVVDGYEMTTYDSYTMSIQADEVYLAGLTVENDAGRVGQAVALETRGDRIWIDRCRLIGDQDTFFTKGYVSRVYVIDTYIEGTTDFIFGPSIVYFRHCSIHCKADSYITAASTTERNRFGYIFDSCCVTAAEGVKKLYLGRPWKSTARTVWICCELPAAIRSEGWHNWRDPARERTSFYAEWGCTGPGADRSGRVAWSHELTLEQAVEHTDLEQVFAKKTGSEQFHDDWNLCDTTFLGLQYHAADHAFDFSIGRLSENRRKIERFRHSSKPIN